MDEIKNNPRVTWLLLLAWCLGLTFLAYGSALGLPFFFDDFVHIPFVDGHDLGEIWQTAGNLAYYRPLPFSLWKVMAGLTSGHNPAWQHALNLLLHAGNGFLVGWLAGNLWAEGVNKYGGEILSPVRIFLSATLFLLYPFSYQAVPWVGSMSHLLVTNLILLSLATYWQMRRTNRKIWGGLSLLLAILAPFAHENGILVGPLLAVILFTRRGYRENIGRNVRHIILWTLPALLWLPIWWLAPKGVGGGVGIRGAETIFQNGAYLLQGAGYPLSWLGGRFREWMGLNDMVAAVGLSSLALAGAAVVQWLGGAGRRSWLPWLWAGLCALPFILLLSFDYVINGPRLLMLASAGFAWLWADVALQGGRWAGIYNFESAKKYWPRTAIIIFLFTVVLLQNFSFVRARMTFHEMLGSPFRQAAAQSTEASQMGKGVVIVNLPAWLAPGRATYALGHEGVQFWPDYAPPETLVSVNGGEASSFTLVQDETIRPEMSYYYGLSGGPTDWGSEDITESLIFAAEYQDGGVYLQPAGSLTNEKSKGEIVAQFGQPPGIFLMGTKASRSEEGLEINLQWLVDQPPAEHVTAFVHVVDEGGKLVAQKDGDPFSGTYPLSRWGAGTSAEDIRVIDDEGKGLRILVGLYNRLTGERLPAFSSEGVAWPEDAFPLAVQ